MLPAHWFDVQRTPHPRVADPDPALIATHTVTQSSSCFAPLLRGRFIASCVFVDTLRAASLLSSSTVDGDKLLQPQARPPRLSALPFYLSAHGDYAGAGASENQ